VILVRPGRTAPIDCYLIRRAATMRFLGGYYAFPGGKVDLGDQRGEALARVRGLAGETATARLGDADDAVPALAYWLTAVRELFEETGLLLAVDGAGHPVEPGTPAVANRLEAHRRALVRGERSFTAILSHEGWLADAAPLAYLSHFITPPSSPIRYSARFFLCPLPAGQTPRVILEEASEGLWATPAEAYARFRAGEWPMAEPAEYGTQYLAQFPSFQALWAHHDDGRHKFHGIIHRPGAARPDVTDPDPVVQPRV
jgi:8-oxo-dGTP pyrophosphatase MutT (NUDIX family)